MVPMNIKIGIIGMGNMGEAILKGLISNGFERGLLSFFDKMLERRQEIAKQYNVAASGSNAEVVKNSDYVILAVKPQDIEVVLKDIKLVQKGRVIVSIAAGTTLSRINSVLGGSANLVRIMPNIAAITGEGACGIYISPGLADNDVKNIVNIFSTIGKVVILKDEWLLDIVTGLSGSGPAYVFVMMEALSDAGVKLGLPRSIARLLAIQTVMGAAKLAVESDRHFAELRDMVTSPGGTTMAGLKALEDKRFRTAIMDAVEAATKRAKELSR